MNVRTKASSLKERSFLQQIESQRLRIEYLKGRNAAYKEEVKKLNRKIYFHEANFAENEEVLKIVRVKADTFREDAIKWKAEAESASLLSKAWLSSEAQSVRTDEGESIVVSNITNVVVGTYESPITFEAGTTEDVDESVSGDTTN